MMVMILLGSATAVKAEAAARKRGHQPETGKGRAMQIGTEIDIAKETGHMTQKLKGEGSGRRVEAEREMIMKGIELEKGRGIGEERENEWCKVAMKFGEEDIRVCFLMMMMTRPWKLAVEMGTSPSLCFFF